jgi:transcriptional regulator with XRE-family HTH domain
MAGNVSEAVSIVLEALGLSAAQLAQLLGASRQSIYRWSSGAPAEGVHEMVLTGVARELAKADDWTLTAWKSNVTRALKEHGSSFEALRALVQRPPGWDAVGDAWRTIQAAPEFTLRLNPTTPSGRRFQEKLQKVPFRVGELQRPKKAKPRRKA